MTPALVDPVAEPEARTIPTPIATPITIGIVDYPGAQRAAIYGLLDLFATAERLRAERASAPGKAGAPLDAIIIEVQAVPPAEPGALAALILPPSLQGIPAPGLAKKSLIQQLVWVHSRLPVDQWRQSGYRTKPPVLFGDK